MFPFMVMAQKNMAHMNNNMPAMTALQEKISDARRRGGLFEMAQLTQELQNLTKKKGINPFKNMIPMGAQLPVFMSFFFGLRGMTNCPVESMSTGGIFWFENLTVTDPFYLLPLHGLIELVPSLQCSEAKNFSIGLIDQHVICGDPLLEPVEDALQLDYLLVVGDAC